MSLEPRVVVVYRRSVYEEMLQRHGTVGQAEFFLAERGLSLEAVRARHDAVSDARATVSAAIGRNWRRTQVERAELARFAFEPEDVVVVVGQDGLLANVAKYVAELPVVGVNPEPDINPGVLVRHRPAETAELLERAIAAQTPERVLTMVEAETDSGRLRALNEIYIGHRSHQSARYLLRPPRLEPERQSSSGVIVGTGTGATGWLRSIARDRGDRRKMPAPADRSLCWFVREAWPSPATGVAETEGVLGKDDKLTIVAESDALAAFGDGVESDAVVISWGQSITLRVARTGLHLI